MKHITLLTGLILVVATAFAQQHSQADTIPIATHQTIPDSMFVNTSGPMGGLELRTGWRYHRGDSSAWEKPDWDDQAWTQVNPWQPSSKLSQIPPQGIGWLRLHFRLGDTLRHQPLLLRLQQYGASEVYLNGRLIGRFGQVSAQPDQIKTCNPLYHPIPLHFDDQADQVLAIRFAPWPAIRHFNEQFHPVFIATRLITPAQVEEVNRYVLNQLLLAAFLLGLCLLLALFHTAFFVYNPAQRANLYFIFYAGSLAASAGGVFLETLTQEVELNMLSNAISFVSIQLFFLWLLRALYALFSQRPTVLYYGLWSSTILVSIPITMSDYVSNWFTIILFFQVTVLLTLIEQLRLTIQAFRRKQRGVRAIVIGFVISAVAMILFIIIIQLEIPYSDVTAILFGLVTLLSPALCISLYLAREFALDSRLLQVKLVEVQNLSAQTIAQEQEKQQLLATQNERLEHQVETRTAELNQSLTELKTTQAQLIQKEKLASLGELTAGIAHEIQNPLNFVNNFSEVSTELVEELKDELDKGDTEEARAIADDLSSNLQKIHHHGGRASSIVRGMLEHSRTASGEVQPTDLNGLCEEYLRLAYHGHRAKDFNCELVTKFDPSVGNVKLMSQEMGRVLLNLFTNAFYAVRDRQQRADSAYRPIIRVSTRRTASGIEIRVSDNGTGMSAEVKDKVFQPFFTTKPTGEGTGLGLSLSYDIITKGHEGSLRVVSQEGEGTEFTVELPLAKAQTAG